MTASQYILRSAQIALRAAQHIQGLPCDGDHHWEVIIKPYKASKTREMEAKYHAMIGDITNQVKIYGQHWKPEDMKRILVDAFKDDTRDDPDLGPEWAAFGDMRVAPKLRGGGVVVLGEQTRRFSRKLAAAFIEWLYAFGAEYGVVWKRHE